MNIERLKDLKPLADRLKGGLATCIMGKDDVIEDLLAAVLAGGHVLLEDLPGTGKTTLAKALARLIDGDFKRIQFTPDLLPSELTGINYYNQKEQSFEFRPGALFTNILLADEINRATPRTQSALLEAMEERQITVDGTTYPLPRPFLVLATQNPVEIQGTFPLPEAQLDRFLMRLSLGYPGEAAERQMLDAYRDRSPVDALEPVTDGDGLKRAMDLVRTVTVSPAIKDYILELTRRTRDHEQIRLGISPRGSLALMYAAQAYAAIEGSSYVLPDHVQHAVRPVLTHRLMLRGTELDQQTARAIEALDAVVAQVSVPTEAEMPAADDGAEGDAAL